MLILRARGIARALSLVVLGGCIAQQDLGDRPSESDAATPAQPGSRLEQPPTESGIAGLDVPAALSPICGCQPGSAVTGSAPQLTELAPQGGYLCAPDESFDVAAPPYCGEELTTCGDACVDTDSDPLHCGGCDDECAIPGRGMRACISGVCTTCGEGYTSCPGNAPWLATRCMDLATDLQHCGACGTPCDGACIGGLCQPIGQVELASGVQGDDLALDDDYVYFGSSITGGLSSGAIARVHRSGGPKDILVGSAVPNRIAVDGGFVYWSAQNAIYRVDREGGAAVLIATAALPWGLAVDDIFVYWAERGTSLSQPFANSAIRRVPKSGGPSEVLASLPEQLGRELVADDTHVYFTHLASVDPDVGFISRVPKWGGEVEFVSPAGASHIALDATHVYGIDGSVASGGLEARTKAPSMDSHSLAYLGQSQGHRVAVSDDFVYVDGHRVPKCGGRIAKFVNDVLRMKAADGDIYWTFDGALHKRKE